MFGVKFLGHGGDAAPRDGLLAAGAQGATALVVVHLAVGLPVVFKKAAIDEGGKTFLLEENQTTVSIKSKKQQPSVSSRGMA